MTSNPGIIFPGGMVVDHNGIIKEKYSWEAGHGTNMLVELLGVEQGLRLSYNYHPTAINVFSANLPIIERLRGTVLTRAHNLADAHSRIMDLVQRSNIPVLFQWIPKDGMIKWDRYLHEKGQQGRLLYAQ